MSEAKWTVVYAPGKELVGVDATIAEMEDSEPYSLAGIKIPETSFVCWWDDRQPQKIDHLAVAHLMAAAPSLLSALERARNGVGGLRRAMEERGEAIALASLDGIYMDIDEAIAAAKGE